MCVSVIVVVAVARVDRVVAVQAVHVAVQVVVQVVVAVAVHVAVQVVVV